MSEELCEKCGKPILHAEACVERVSKGEPPKVWHIRCSPDEMTWDRITFKGKCVFPDVLPEDVTQ